MRFALPKVDSPKVGALGCYGFGLGDFRRLYALVRVRLPMFPKFSGRV